MKRSCETHLEDEMVCSHQYRSFLLRDEGIFSKKVRILLCVLQGLFSKPALFCPHMFEAFKLNF